LILGLARALDVSVPYLMNTKDFEALEDLDRPEDILSTLATSVPIAQVEEVEEPVASEEKQFIAQTSRNSWNY
ncbi:MAG TPA: hypothetical protein V6D50_08390, partial [Chroococcales cyanobacterium]